MSQWQGLYEQKELDNGNYAKEKEQFKLKFQEQDNIIDSLKRKITSFEEEQKNFSNLDK